MAFKPATKGQDSKMELWSRLRILSSMTEKELRYPLSESLKPEKRRTLSEKAEVVGKTL